jgi:hypothetical protein
MQGNNQSAGRVPISPAAGKGGFALSIGELWSHDGTVVKVVFAFLVMLPVDSSLATLATRWGSSEQFPCLLFVSIRARLKPRSQFDSGESEGFDLGSLWYGSRYRSMHVDFIN